MTEKRFLEDVPTETLLAKLRRANASMSEAISCELLFRQTFFKPGTENENLPSVANVRLSGNDVPKIQYIDPVKVSIPESVFFIGYDCYDKNNCVYALYRRIGETTEIINIKKSRDESQFMEEVNNVAKYFNAQIIESK